MNDSAARRHPVRVTSTTTVADAVPVRNVLSA